MPVLRLEVLNLTQVRMQWLGDVHQHQRAAGVNKKPQQTVYKKQLETTSKKVWKIKIKTLKGICNPVLVFHIGVNRRMN